MPTLEGGKRDRMIWYAVWDLIREHLDMLGWLQDPVTNNLPRQPVEIPFGGFPDGEAITPNGIAVMPFDTTFVGLEVGSTLSRGDQIFVVDIFAEDHATGVALRGDISAILRGEYPSIGRTRNVVEVYDQDLATPALIATLDIEDVRNDKAPGGAEAWERYWYSILFVVEDEDWAGIDD